MKKTESKAFYNFDKAMGDDPLGFNGSTRARKKMKRYFWLRSKRIAKDKTSKGYGKTSLALFREICSIYTKGF